MKCCLQVNPVWVQTWFLGFKPPPLTYSRGPSTRAEDVREAPWSSSQHWGLQAGGQKSCGGGEHVFTHTAPTPALSQVLCEPGLSQALDLPSSCHLLLQP